MDGRTTREVIIEIERIQLVRKRAKTDLHYCEKCEGPSDFVGLDDAARLFEVGRTQLFNFIQTNGSHFIDDISGGKQICLASLLERMRTIGGANKLEDKTNLNFGVSNEENHI